MDARVGVAPLAKSCRTPAGTTTTSPASATIRSRPHPEAHRALEDLEALLLLRVHVQAPPAPAGPAGSSRSMARSSPFVCAAVARKVIRSQLAGFSSVCPIETMVVSVLAWPLRRPSAPGR